MMERTAITSILAAFLLLLTAARSNADSEYEKICVVGGNLNALEGNVDANSCRQIAVSSQAQEYQIGCRDSANNSMNIVTPFSITDKAARVTGAKLAANAQNTATAEQLTKCAMAWGSR